MVSDHYQNTHTHTHTHCHAPLPKMHENGVATRVGDVYTRGENSMYTC